MTNLDLSPLSNFAARLRDAMGTLNEAEFQLFSLELFGLQFELNSAYRKYCLACEKTPENVCDWRDIPAIPTAAFKELDVTSLPAAERTRVFHSSGTTQQRPSRHFHSVESLELYETSLLAWFPAHVLNASGAGALGFLSLTPRSGEAPTSSLVHMFETLARKFAPSDPTFTGRVGAEGGWEVDLPRTLEALESAIDCERPVILLATAFGFVQLIDHLAASRKRLQLPADSRVLETGGYKGRSRALPKSEFDSLISELLGVPPQNIISEFGMSELSSQAYAKRYFAAKNGLPPSSIFHPQSSIYRFPPWARVQIVSPETGREASEGETGLIRIFDLANVWSVMAVQTEDLGIRRGDGLELIGRAALAEPRGCSLMAI